MKGRHQMRSGYWFSCFVNISSLADNHAGDRMYIHCPRFIFQFKQYGENVTCSTERCYGAIGVAIGRAAYWYP